jgi:DNA-binding beta-propeller fold protein YncE
MDETSLRELFERVIEEEEPPIGPVAQQGIQAGVRLRRRHRLQNAAACVTAIVVVAAVLVGAVLASSRGGQPPAVAGPATVYVLGTTGGIGQEAASLTPIPVATNTPGAPIPLNAPIPLVGQGDNSFGPMKATPDRKTIYVAEPQPGETVTPVSTATGTAGTPISAYAPLGKSYIVASPDGKTVYVLGADGPLMPISTATNRPGPLVQPWGQAVSMSIAITPNGRTLYVGVGAQNLAGPFYVFPISTATDKPGQPIRVAGSPEAIVVTPDGRTAYVIGQTPPHFSSSHVRTTSGEVIVTPISTATNTPGPAVIAGRGGLGPVVMTPDGQHIYIGTADPSSLIPFSTVTDSAGSPVSFASSSITALAAAPDGRTVYAAAVRWPDYAIQCPAMSFVTPVAAATGRPGKPVQVACDPVDLAVTPDSKTVYVASRQGIVTPIAAATGQPGTPIQVRGDLSSLLITP